MEAVQPTGLLLFCPAPLVAGRVTTTQLNDQGTVVSIQSCFSNACSCLQILRRSCLSSVRTCGPDHAYRITEPVILTTDQVILTPRTALREAILGNWRKEERNSPHATSAVKALDGLIAVCMENANTGNEFEVAFGYDQKQWDGFGVMEDVFASWDGRGVLSVAGARGTAKSVSLDFLPKS